MIPIEQVSFMMTLIQQNRHNKEKTRGKLWKTSFPMVAKSWQNCWLLDVIQICFDSLRSGKFGQKLRRSLWGSSVTSVCKRSSGPQSAASTGHDWIPTSHDRYQQQGDINAQETHVASEIGGKWIPFLQTIHHFKLGVGSYHSIMQPPSVLDFSSRQSKMTRHLFGLSSQAPKN